MATPQQPPYESEEDFMPELPHFFPAGVNIPMSGPNAPGVFRVHTTMHSPLGMPPDAMFQNFQGRGGFKYQSQ